MQEQIAKIESNAFKEIEGIKDLKELNDLRVKYLGKKGELTLILRGMGGLTPEERPIIGRSEERRVGKECRSRWSPYH